MLLCQDGHPDLTAPPSCSFMDSSRSPSLTTWSPGQASQGSQGAGRPCLSQSQSLNQRAWGLETARLGFKCPPNNPPNLSPAFLVCEMGQQSPSRPAHGRHGLLLAVTMLYQNCPLAGWPEHRTKTSRTSVSGHLTWPGSRPGPVGCAPSSHLPLCLLGSDRGS